MGHPDLHRDINIPPYLLLLADTDIIVSAHCENLIKFLKLSHNVSWPGSYQHGSNTLKMSFFPVQMIFLTKCLGWRYKNPHELYRTWTFQTCTEQTGNTVNVLLLLSLYCSLKVNQKWLIICLHLTLFMKSHRINNWLLSGRNNS